MKLNNLHTQVLGKNFEYYEKIDSTQKEIWSRVTENRIENGTVICAGVQESGVGTHGRVWHTDEKNNIAFSFYLNLNVEIEKLDGVTYAEALQLLLKHLEQLLIKEVGVSEEEIDRLMDLFMKTLPAIWREIRQNCA